MSDTNPSSTVTLNIKGPSALKLSLSIGTDQTVLQLKQRIEAENSDFPTECQRLIYSGKVLKDPDTLASYNVQDNHTIHMVRSAKPAGAGAGAGAGSSASSAQTSASQAAQSRGVPASFSAGQQFANNPLSALNRADYAGPHMASILNEAGGMFSNFGGMNPRDPNVMLGMMQNPEFLQQMRDMLGRPEVVDQIIANNPQMQAMGPHVREMMRSEYFRDLVTNPEMIQRMTQLSQLMGGHPGAGAAPAWPPPGAFGTSPAAQDSQRESGAGAGAPGAGTDPLAGLAQLQQMLGGAGAGAGTTGLNPFAAALGGFGGMGGSGAGGGQSTDSRPPEERYASQLEQLQNMGFLDARANLRALLMSGGSVEGAVSILLD